VKGIKPIQIRLEFMQRHAPAQGAPNRLAALVGRSGFAQAVLGIVVGHDRRAEFTPCDALPGRASLRDGRREEQAHAAHQN
jgi:hypothetical protein